MAIDPKTNDNMCLWSQVDETPPNLIGRAFLSNGTVLNTVPNIFRLKRATELFGVYGKKWGLKNIKHSEQVLADGLILGIIDSIFFVSSDICETEFEITNSITIVSNDRLIINDNYRKSIETDTITKALSRLGFNADIYTDKNIVKPPSETKKSFSGFDLIEINQGEHNE